jgi:hypothetical protein
MLSSSVRAQSIEIVNQAVRRRGKIYEGFHAYLNIARPTRIAFVANAHDVGGSFDACASSDSLAVAPWTNHCQNYLLLLTNFSRPN